MYPQKNRIRSFNGSVELYTKLLLLRERIIAPTLIFLKGIYLTKLKIKKYYHLKMTISVTCFLSCIFDKIKWKDQEVCFWSIWIHYQIRNGTHFVCNFRSSCVIFPKKEKKMTFFFKVLESNSSYGQYLLYRLKFVDHVT